MRNWTVNRFPSFFVASFSDYFPTGADMYTCALVHPVDESDGGGGLILCAYLDVHKCPAKAGVARLPSNSSSST
jgi:hypothetical protein